MTITTEDLRKLLADATPGPWKACEMSIHGRKYGGCWVEGPDVDDGDGLLRGVFIPISGSGGSMSYTTRLFDMQGHDHNDANARAIATWPDLATELLAARAKIEAAEKMVDVLAWLMEHRSFCYIPSIEGEWDERANAALAAWEALK